MSDETDLIKLYSARILALTAEIPHLGRMEAPQASVKRRSPLCGSTVTVDVRVEQGRLDGERTLVLRQVQHRFGTVPPTLRLRLQNASQTELEHLADRILDASSVDDLFQ